MCTHLCRVLGTNIPCIMDPKDSHMSTKAGGWSRPSPSSLFLTGALTSYHLRGAPGTELVSEEELVRVMALEQGLVP